MSLGVEDGRPVVRRVVGAADREQLRQVGERLERAAHPGVVRVVASGPCGDGWELTTEHGGQAVAAAAWSSAEAVADVVGAVAETLADLHERGVVHGGLDGRRILLGRGSGPVLCGLAPTSAPGAPAPTPADDVAALGRVLGGLLAPMAPTGAAGKARLAALRSIAEAAGAAPASRRPTARRLAIELVGAPVSSLPTRRPRRGLALGAGAVALVLVAIVVVRRPSTSAAPRPARPAALTSPSTTPPVLRCVATRRRSISAADCGHDVQVEGAAVVVDGRRYVVGLAGDEVAVADWDCAGALRAAVLRPATGELRVFGAFTADRALSVVRAERVAPGRALDPRAADGCATLGAIADGDEAGSEAGGAGPAIMGS